MQQLNPHADGSLQMKWAVKLCIIFMYIQGETVSLFVSMLVVQGGQDEQMYHQFKFNKLTFKSAKGSS